MSHDRTVSQFVAEVEHSTGRRIEIRWILFRGIVLEEEDSGIIYAFGGLREGRTLSPAEQESLCRVFGVDPTLLGLDPPLDD
jgi:hypothetical protein